MAQHDYNIINGAGAAVRQDINAALAAIVSNNSGPVAPLVKLPGTLWFDTSAPETPGTLRVYGLDGLWHSVEAGAVYLPLTGGNVIGDLTVTGVFSNPDFNARRKSYISATAPAAPVPGQLWYDTAATPDSLKIRNAANTAWETLVNVNSPTFTQMVNVEGVGAEVGLIASGEKRRIVNDPSVDQIRFYSPSNALMAAVGDHGDLWIAGLGNWIGSALQTKQANLGFTPVQQTGGNAIMIGSYPANLWIDGAHQGVIRMGDLKPLFLTYQVGSYARLMNNGSGMQLNGYGYLGSHFKVGDASGPVPPGNWRVMGGSMLVGDVTLCMRYV